MRKISSIIITLLLLVSIVLPTGVGAQSTADIQAQINALMAQLKVLQAQLAAQQGGQTQAFCYTFTRNLRIGDKGLDVHYLQRALEREGIKINAPLIANAYSTELAEDYAENASLGEATASAVSGFQEKYRSEILTPNGLARGNGYVGPSTRAKLNALYGCGQSTSLPTPITPVTITIDKESLVTSSNMPVLSGNIYNTSLLPIGVSISNAGGDKVWGSGNNITAINNRWTTKVNSALSVGTYQVNVYSSNNTLLTSRTLEVTAKDPYVPNQPVVTMVRGKATNNFEADATLPVSIEGKNLMGSSVASTKVYIGGVLAPITQTGDTLIYVTTPDLPTGNYTLTISHDKGTSIPLQIKVVGKNVWSGQTQQPSIQVLSPNGGEVYQSNGSLAVSWVHSNNVGPISIRLFNSLTGVEYYKNASFSGGAGSGKAGINLSGEALNVPSGQYRITVCDEGSVNPQVTFKPLCDSSDTSFTINSVSNSSGVPITARLIETPTADRAGVWHNFGPGTGNINKNPVDFYWWMEVGGPENGQKVIKRITIKHNTPGEVWSTGYSRYLSNGTDLYGYEEHPYPLVVSTEGVQLNTKYDQFSKAPPAMGGAVYSLYGQKESTKFTGGQLIVEFTDGTSATATIAPGTVASATNVDLTPVVITVAGEGTNNQEIYAGATVAILGSNLLGGASTASESITAVYIGKQQCAITRANNTLLYCTAPTDLIVGSTYQLVITNTRSVSNSVPVKVLSKLPSSAGTPSVQVISPNGGEVWPNAGKVTDTISGFDSYRRDIEWSGGSTQDARNDAVVAYLEKINSQGNFEIVGRIPPFAYGSIAWVSGVVGQSNCNLVYPSNLPDHCFNKSTMKVVPAGQYYVRLVDTKTGTSDRSDAPFIITSPESVQNASITITYPSRGTTLYKGVGYNFQATGPADIRNVEMKINDPRGINVKVIKADIVSKNSTFYWTIPSTWVDGQYVITATADGKPVSIYNNIFQVTAKPVSSASPTSYLEQLQQIANSLSALQGLLQGGGR